MRRIKTVAAGRAEAAQHLAKAAQFLEVARHSVEGRRYDAGRLNAIHAGISAADAVTAAPAGERSADPNHIQAVTLLERVAGDSEPVRMRARQLRMLIEKKNAVEYESRRASSGEASQAVERADRIVSWARDAVEQGRL